MNKKNKFVMFLTILLSIMMLGNAVVAVNVEKNKEVAVSTNIEVKDYSSNSFKYDLSDMQDWEVTKDDSNSADSTDTGGTFDDIFGWFPSGHTGVYSNVEDRTIQRHQINYHERWVNPWMVCAAECGPLPTGIDKTTGHTILKSPDFSISDFDNKIDLDGFGFMIREADFYFDWEFGSKDFSNNDRGDDLIEYVKISNINLVSSSGSTDIRNQEAKDELNWHPWSIGRPNGDSYMYTNSYDYPDMGMIGDFKASSNAFKDTLNDNLESSFNIEIHLKYRLVAGAYNTEMFEFYLNDAKIKGKYGYPQPNLNIPDDYLSDKIYKRNDDGDFHCSGSFEIENNGESGTYLDWKIVDWWLDWDWLDWETLSTPPDLEISSTEGSNLKPSTSPPEITVSADFDKNFISGDYRWIIKIKGTSTINDYENQFEYVTVSFKVKKGTSKIKFLDFPRISNIFSLLNLDIFNL